jgi:RNA polymerase sigma-70 factor (ECF subfamily)
VLRQAVFSLPIHYREVVILCDLEEVSYMEAAQIFGCAIGTIRSRLNRAHKILLERLKRNERVQRVPKGGRVVRSLV